MTASTHDGQGSKSRESTGSLKLSRNVRGWLAVLGAIACAAAGFGVSLATVSKDYGKAEAEAENRVTAVEARVAGEAETRAQSEQRMTAAVEAVASELRAMRRDMDRRFTTVETILRLRGLDAPITMTPAAPAPRSTP